MALQLQVGMKAFLKLFDSQLDRDLDTKNYIDCQQSPSRLLRQLKSSSEQKKLAKYIEKSTTNPFKIIRSLSVANLLLLYSNDYFGLIQNHLKSRTGKDEWLNTKFLNPYYKFLIRCCTSKEIYLQSRTTTVRKGEALEMLFYTINMLKLLFKALQKMPLLGRYYLQKHKEVISTAIQVIALQAQKLYGAFKASLTEILYQRKTYIQTPEDQTIMKGILIDELSYINEEMKRLFLDKYFYPLGKGIGVKLFRPEEQTSECQKTIHSIVTNHHDTQRQKRRDLLQKTLFPGYGLVNWNFYEQTLLSCTINNITGRKEDGHFKQLDDLAIDQGDEDELSDQDQPNNKTTMSKEKQSDKSTNTGTVQSLGNQM